MDAARWGDETDIDLLIHAGAQIIAQNNAGETALIYAIDACRADNVDRLLKHHADPNVKEWNGKTALTIAERSRAAHMNTPFNHEFVDEEWG
jgi:ankyrin repeat protein